MMKTISDDIKNMCVLNGVYAGTFFGILPTLSRKAYYKWSYLAISDRPLWALA
jgi:hypothetical protein